LNTAVYSPSRYEVGKIYLHRIFNWRRSSSPYLSGDSFADICDYVYKPPRFRSFRGQKIPLSQANSIFVSSIDFFDFLEFHSSDLKKKIIIVGNGDHDFTHPLDSGIVGSENIFFLQNSFISDSENIFTLPIGVENLRWGLNGSPKLLRNQNNQRKNKVLIGPFGKTHSQRDHVNQIFSKEKGPWDFYQGYITPQNFNQLSSEYRYIACVRGNGEDTHRLWETMYRGIIPVLLRNKWSESLNDLKLPLALVNSWEPKELYRIVEELSELSFNPTEIESLWMPYWIKKFRDQKLEPVAPK
jgi:hypothetical protein